MVDLSIVFRMFTRPGIILPPMSFLTIPSTHSTKGRLRGCWWGQYPDSSLLHVDLGSARIKWWFTLWLWHVMTNIAMENDPFIVDLPIEIEDQPSSVNHILPYQKASDIDEFVQIKEKHHNPIKMIFWVFHGMIVGKQGIAAHEIPRGFAIARQKLNKHLQVFQSPHFRIHNPHHFGQLIFRSKNGHFWTHYSAPPRLYINSNAWCRLCRTSWWPHNAMSISWSSPPKLKSKASNIME